MVKDEDLCNLVCEDEDFISRVIIQPLSSQASRDPSGDDPFPRERKAVVAVFYPTLSHQVTLQSKPNIEYWFSKLGGDLGMCVGASVITIIEVILFLLYLLLLLLKKLARGISSLLAS
nr:acid-sensing ion channel 5-like [Penaeus vannamei]